MSTRGVISDDANQNEALKLAALIQKPWFLDRFGFGQSQENRVTISM
jgi:hypothetical protein